MLRQKETFKAFIAAGKIVVEEGFLPQKSGNLQKYISKFLIEGYISITLFDMI